MAAVWGLVDEFCFDLLRVSKSLCEAWHIAAGPTTAFHVAGNTFADEGAKTVLYVIDSRIT